MESILTPSSLASWPGNVAATSPSEGEEVLRPGTSSQDDSQPALDKVPADNLPLIFKHIERYFGPSKANGKMKCKFCNKEISYSATSYYNLKCHYERQHSGEYPNLVAALRAGSKRGRHSSRGSDQSLVLKKRESCNKSTCKEKFDQMKALKLYYKKVDQLTRTELVKGGTSLRDYKTKLLRNLEKSGSKPRVELEHEEEMNLFLDTTSGTSKSPLSCPVNSLLVPPESLSPIRSQESMQSPDHSQNLLKVVTNLFLQSRYSDTTIVCEGQLFPAHKVVLAASCGYFDEIFSLLPDKSSVIVLKDIGSDIFNDLLKFIYFGEVQIEQSKVMNFINAASSLKVRGIPRINLCPNNTDIVADEVEACGSKQNILSDDSLLASAPANKACAPFVFVAKHVPLERRACGRKRRVPSGCITLESAPSKKAYTSSDNVDTATAKKTSTLHEPQVPENKPKFEFLHMTVDESEARQNSRAAVNRSADGLPSVIKTNEDNGCLATVMEECWIKEEFECENHPLETQEEISCSSIKTTYSEEDEVSASSVSATVCDR